MICILCGRCRNGGEKAKRTESSAQDARQKHDIPDDLRTDRGSFLRDRRGQGSGPPSLCDSPRRGSLSPLDGEIGSPQGLDESEGVFFPWWCRRRWHRHSPLRRLQRRVRLSHEDGDADGDGGGPGTRGERASCATRREDVVEVPAGPQRRLPTHQTRALRKRTARLAWKLQGEANDARKTTENARDGETRASEWDKDDADGVNASAKPTDVHNHLDVAPAGICACLDDATEHETALACLLARKKSSFARMCTTPSRI